MALQRRTGPSPYEVMANKTASQSAANRSKSEGDAGTAPGASGGSHDSAGGEWREYAGGPITLRIPRGYLVLAAFVLLLSLVLVYAIGHNRGYERAKADQIAQEKEIANAKSVMSSQRREDVAAPANTAPPTANKDQTSPPATPGTEQHLVLARYDRKTADRLVKFLAEFGVDTALVSIDNGRLFLVVDRHAFDEQEIRQRSAQYEQRKQQIKRLGRNWKEKEKGPTDLADLQPQAFVTTQNP